VHGFLTSPGFEAALQGEIAGSGSRFLRWPAAVAVADPGPPVGGTLAGGRAVAGGETVAGGGTLAGGGVPPLDPVFARQSLPAAVQVRGDSVKALAEAVYGTVADAIDDAATGFVLHTFVPDPDAYAHLAGRAALIATALEALLRQRRRRAVRRLLTGADPFSDDVLVVQSALVGRTSMLISAARPRRLRHGGWDLAPWPAGIAPVPEDRSAPSRAYGKLEESFAWLGSAPAPGQRCVDLGGAPGGWSWCALKRGATVLAVDRAPLLPPAAGHPGLTVVRGDAFAYHPPAPVDWLLCDVICAPARTLATVEQWMTEGWCRSLVATLKFKGHADYALLPEARRRLTTLGWRHIRMKHLYRHHNEVAILATRT
jgi:23S rRNA (cytidine2498-2'-O)-methyltransferase